MAQASKVQASLVAWLKARHPRDMLMPLMGTTKRPRFAHKGGVWSWAKYDEHARSAEAGGDVGLLLVTLCALDFDDENTALEFERRFEVLQRAPMETTKHGRHYIFLRPAWADAEGFFDGARQVQALAVDFKSVCSTGTSGLLVVAPSQGKAWVRPPWEYEPFELPRELMEAVARSKQGPKYAQANKQDASGVGQQGGAPTKPAEQDTVGRPGPVGQDRDGAQERERRG